jgi:hypothetical protein
MGRHEAILQQEPAIPPGTIPPAARAHYAELSPVMGGPSAGYTHGDRALGYLEPGDFIHHPTQVTADAHRHGHGHGTASDPRFREQHGTVYDGMVARDATKKTSEAVVYTDDGLGGLFGNTSGQGETSAAHPDDERFTYENVRARLTATRLGRWMLTDRRPNRENDVSYAARNKGGNHRHHDRAA